MESTNSKSLAGIAIGTINVIRGGVTTDDSNTPPLRLVMWQVEYYRMKAISDWAEAHRFEPLDPQLQSDLGCLPLETVDMAECECIKWGCNVKKVKLPKFIFHAGRVQIGFIGLIDKRTRFVIAANPQAIKAMMESRFANPDAIYGYIIGQNLYVVTKADMTLLCYVNVRGWLERPSEEAAGCFDIWSEDYPIDAKFIPYITRSIMEEYLGVEQIPHDHKNNANHK